MMCLVVACMIFEAMLSTGEVLSEQHHKQNNNDSVES